MMQLHSKAIHPARRCPQQPRQQRQRPGASPQSAAAVPPQSAAAAAAVPGTPANPEFPPYKVLKQGGDYGLRLYEVYPVVEMEYQRREEGYLLLGGYQAGENATAAKFGFTQPVIMCYHPDGRKVMQMMVGTPKQQQQQQQGGITSLPAPSEPDVRLSVAGGELVAVGFFEGYITPEAADGARRRLTEALKRDGIQLAEEEAAGFFRVGQYGQVHTLEQRVNELLLKVQV